MSSRWDQSEKRNNNNKSSETVPIAEHKILKDKYESLLIEHESLIKTLELLEKTHGFTVDDLVNKQRGALERKEEIAKWDNMFGEMQKKLETVEKNIEYIMAVDDDIEMNGVVSGSAGPAKKPNVMNSVTKEGSARPAKNSVSEEGSARPAKKADVKNSVSEEGSGSARPAKKSDLKNSVSKEGSARPAKKPDVKNSVSKEDVINLSDDEEGNGRESNRRHSNSSHQNPFIL